MAKIIQGTVTDLYPRELHNVEYSYDYPDNLDLRPSSELHKAVLNKLLERATLAAENISTRFSSWQDQDMFLTAYKRPDDDEIKIKNSDERKPISIVFPYSYAILETLLSYMVAAFFRDPIFRYEGVSGEDVVGAILLQKVIALHCIKTKVALNLHTMFRDSFTYGFGTVHPIWKMSQNRKFEGNALLNIDPYKYLPDPNVDICSTQEGEFVGWTNQTNYINLLSEEFNDADLFNVKYLKNLSQSGTTLYDDSGRYFKTGQGKKDSDVTRSVIEMPMYVNLIPKEWKLGSSEKPEKWFFRVGNDSVILSARPADFNHEKYPVANIAPDFDGYSGLPLSRLEVLGGLQGVLDWLFNSHIANVRKAINDTIIYDPYMINSGDLRDPKPGKLVRLRRPAWGQGKINESYSQLKITDITQQHMGDTNWIINGMQMIGATDQATMGGLRSGGPDRLTKAEYQGTNSGGVNRLERIAKLSGLQGMQDIGEFFAEHTQQLMDESMYIKVHGEWQRLLINNYRSSISRGRMKVSPTDLDINFDVIVRDGSVPGGNSSEIWMKMFQTLAQNPELNQQFDITKIFRHIATNAGAKNVDEFLRQGGGINPQLMQNDQISNEVQKGNLVPLRRNAR